MNYKTRDKFLTILRVIKAYLKSLLLDNRIWVGGLKFITGRLRKFKWFIKPFYLNIFLLFILKFRRVFKVMTIIRH